jgi:hypothetical protein
MVMHTRVGRPRTVDSPETGQIVPEQVFRSPGRQAFFPGHGVKSVCGSKIFVASSYVHVSLFLLPP